MLQEHASKGGLSSIVLESGSDLGRNIPIKRIGVSIETNSQIESREYFLGFSGIPRIKTAETYHSIMN
jgi:hypothetical protein